MRKYFTLLVLALMFTAGAVHASETNGTIVSGGNAGYAWSNQAGWVNFGAANGNISVTDSAITGYAWNSNYGWINMAPSNGGITIAANGALSGYGWGSSLGWINFSGVFINSSGKFTGTASGTIVGTLTFDCTNCSVVTDYRPASARSSGAATPASGGGGGGSIGIIQQPQTATVTVTVTPPATGLDTPGFPPSVEGEGGVIGRDGGVVAEEEEDILPAQLFDIRLLLDRSEISRTEDLVARVTFESFGRVPTPVEMIFTLLDAEGNELWMSVDTTTVQTSAVFVKRYTGAPSLTPGSYTARLDTLYNTDVRDTFEAPFTVLSEGAAASNWILWLMGGVAVIVATLLLFLWRRRRRERDV